MAFNIDNEINKQLNSLEPDETDIEKITKATHRSLLMMSVRYAVMEMREKKKDEKEEDEKENDENEIKLFHELIQKSYLEKLDFIKKQLIFIFFFRYQN